MVGSSARNLRCSSCGSAFANVSAMLHCQHASRGSLDQLGAAITVHGSSLKHQAARYAHAVGKLLHGRVHWCTHAAPPKSSPNCPGCTLLARRIAFNLVASRSAWAALRRKSRRAWNTAAHHAAAPGFSLRNHLCAQVVLCAATKPGHLCNRRRRAPIQSPSRSRRE